MSAARRSLQVVAFICTLVVGAASMALIVTQTTWFKEWLRGFIVRQAEDYVNGRLSIGRLDGNLFFGVELEDVDITQNGQTVLDVKDLILDYNVFTLVGSGAVLDQIKLNQPMIRAVRTSSGWNLVDLIKARTPDPNKPKTRPTLEIHDIAINDGTLYVQQGAVGTSGYDIPDRIDRFDASVGVKSNEDELTVDVKQVSLRAQQPALGVDELTGLIRQTPNQITLERIRLRTEESSLFVDGTIDNIDSDSPVINLKASSEKLVLAEVGRLVPVLRGYDLQPAFNVTASGPADRMAVKADIHEPSLGSANGDLTVDAYGPDKRIAGSATVADFNVGALVPRRPETAPATTVHSNITGHATFDIALPSGRMPLSGSYQATASHVEVVGYEARNVVARGRIDGQVVRVNASASAYGGQATAVGTVSYGTPLAMDLSGTAANVDLRNLPKQLNMPGAPSRLQLSYNLKGRGSVFSGDVAFKESTLAGGTIAPGTTGSFTIGDGAPKYAAKGEASHVDVQQMGRAFNVPSIATDKFRSSLNATFDVKGSGGGRYPLTLEASGTAVDSTMFGATFPRLDFTTSIAGGNIAVKSLGQFSNLDPAVIAGDERMKGNLSGAADVNTTIRDYAGRVRPDSIDVAGRVNLGRSSINDLSIDSAVVDGRYANREGQLMQLSIAGPDLNVTGSGTIALNETGASDLTLHVESPSLDRVGKIVGQPLKGAAVVDAKVTGNAGELKAQGHLQGSNAGYGDNSALTLSTDYTVTVPNLTPANASVQAKTVATFVKVGGQELTELSADTTYSAENLAFNATAKEGVRTLNAAGDVLFHPDHQEVHVKDLGLQAEQVRWTTEPGAPATIQYGNGRIAVENVRLVSGDQRIEADGVIGSATESLKVKATNVDVAQLDQLALGDQRLAGRLSANATISGQTSAPRVEGDFALTQGAFRAFKFDSFGGKLDYSGRGMNVDVRLQQNPQAWLTAKGYAPLTLLQPTPTGITGHVAPAPGEAVNLEVASSQIDLGVVQGFTSYVSNVTGTLQANVKVTGSGYDPHMNGAINIQGGAFAVPDLGTSYTGLNTKVDLNDEGLAISEFKILDSRGFPMTIGGQLGLHERSVGAVDISVTSDKFEVIDNEVADLKLNTQLHVTGELRKPRVEGSVEVENGTIHIDEVLALTSADPYSTTATQVTPAKSAGPAPTLATPSIFQGLEMKLGLVIPSNLVVRGQGLAPANAPISLGDVNITLGGQLEINKAAGEQQARILGEVDTVRGTYTFQGRRFDIQRDGRLRFPGTREIDPSLDIRATREIAGVETTVRVRGTMRAPELSFSSNPPLEEADILSLIIFNAPSSALGEAQQASLGARAGALAGGYLASGLASSIGNALDLDEFEIQTQSDDGTTSPAVMIGEQVGEHLFFHVRQGFGDAQATEFILEYQINQFLRARASVAEIQGGTQRVTFRRVERGGLDLIFFFSY